MGFLSSLFGGGDKRPVVTTNVTSKELPPELAPYIKEILSEGQAQYQADKAAGYQPYTGQTTADLTAQQEAALTGLEGLAGTQKPFLDEAGQIVRGGAEQFTGDVAQQYMSPYQQAVTDIELRKAQEKFEGEVLPRLEAQAVGMGGMSGLGSRAGVEMAEAQRSQNQLLADIQAKGQQRAYDAARQDFAQQKAREREMAGDITRLGQSEFSAGLGELGALKSAGEERQELAQSALDEAYFKFLQEQNYPKEKLTEYSQLVYGNPLTTQGTTTTRKPTLSTGQNLLNLGMGAANLFGYGGGFGSGGFSGDTLTKNLFSGKAKGGQVEGGLSSLPVVNRRIPGTVYSDADTIELERIRNIPNKNIQDAALARLANRVNIPDAAEMRRVALKRSGIQKGLQDTKADEIAKQRRANISDTLSTKREGLQTQRELAVQQFGAMSEIDKDLMGKLSSPEMEAMGLGFVIPDSAKDPTKSVNVLQQLSNILDATGRGVKQTMDTRSKAKKENLIRKAEADKANLKTKQATEKDITGKETEAFTESIVERGKVDLNNLTQRQQNIIDDFKRGVITEQKIEQLPKKLKEEYRALQKHAAALKETEAKTKKYEAESIKARRGKLKDLPATMANHIRASNLPKKYLYKLDDSGAIAITDQKGNPLTTKAQIEETKNFLIALEGYTSKEFDTTALKNMSKAKLNRLEKELERESSDRFSEVMLEFNKTNPNTKILLDITSGAGLKFTKDMRENYNKHKGPNAPAGKAAVIEAYAKRIGSNNYTNNEAKYKEIAKQILELEVSV